MRLVLPNFSDSMARPQRITGWVYLPVHIFILPFALGVLAYFIPLLLDVAVANIVYYGVGFVFCFTVMFTFLRRAFDTLLDNFAQVLLTIFSSMFVYYLLTWLVSYLLLSIMGDAAYDNPNSMALNDMTSAYGDLPTYAMAILLAPIVEETLFRGVLFGAIRKKSRFWAFFVSIAVFGLYHVWQFFLMGYDWKLLLYAMQYIPAGYAMARCYERTSCIWAAILLHAMNNAFVLLVA